MRCAPINLLVIYAKAIGRMPGGVITGLPWRLVNAAYRSHPSSLWAETGGKDTGF